MHASDNHSSETEDKEEVETRVLKAEKYEAYLIGTFTNPNKEFSLKFPANIEKTI